MNWEGDMEEIARKVALQKIQTQWEKIIGPLFYQHSWPEKIYPASLLVLVDHSAYTMELTLLSSQIINKINELFSGFRITKLELRTGNIPYRKVLELPKKKPDWKGKEELLELLETEEDRLAKAKLRELIGVLD